MAYATPPPIDHDHQLDRHSLRQHRGRQRGERPEPATGARNVLPRSVVRVALCDEREVGGSYQIAQSIFSQADGGFDIVVNGGGPLTLTFAKTGYIDAQREIDARHEARPETIPRGRSASGWPAKETNARQEPYERESVSD